MQLSDQVCTLEQAQKLKDLGVNQLSLFYWNSVRFHGNYRTEVYYGKSTSDLITENMIVTSLACAFTVAELGVMLPPGFDTRRLTDRPIAFWRGYDANGKGYPQNEVAFLNEALCRASMLIHLLESETITPSEVNERLHK